VLFELRAGSIADTLPPTIHPGTGTPYRWETPPQNGFPQLPPRLLEIWRDWENTNHAIRALCPWAPPPPSEPRPRREYSGPSVIEAFNAAHDTAAILEQHGYIRQGKRFASPGTSHDAGIVLLDSGKVFAITRAIPLLTSMRSMRSTCIGASITAATTPPQ
jgi:putative DNA primase/helicase